MPQLETFPRVETISGWQYDGSHKDFVNLQKWVEVLWEDDKVFYNGKDQSVTYVNQHTPNIQYILKPGDWLILTPNGGGFVKLTWDEVNLNYVIAKEIVD